MYCVQRVRFDEQGRAAWCQWRQWDPVMQRWSSEATVVPASLVAERVALSDVASVWPDEPLRPTGPMLCLRKGADGRDELALAAAALSDLPDLPRAIEPRQLYLLCLARDHAGGHLVPVPGTGQDDQIALHRKGFVSPDSPWYTLTQKGRAALSHWLGTR